MGCKSSTLKAAVEGNVSGSTREPVDGQHSLAEADDQQAASPENDRRAGDGQQLESPRHADDGQPAEGPRDNPNPVLSPQITSQDQARADAAAAELPTEAITTVSVASPVDERGLVMIVWDIENIRLPNYTAGLSPQDVVRFLKEEFIYSRGCAEYRTVAAVTAASLKHIIRNHQDFLKQVTPGMTVLLASSIKEKRNADVMLKKEISRYITEHAHFARANPGKRTIVLISGDEDFLEAVQSARSAGFSVELVHHMNASDVMERQDYSRTTQWLKFLREKSGKQRIDLPYEDNRNGRNGRGGGFQGRNRW